MFVTKRICAHFFVAKSIYTHFFLSQKLFMHFLSQKEFAHTFLSQKQFTRFFVAKMIYALRLESFCALKVAIWKVQTFWASGEGGALNTELFTAFFVEKKAYHKYQNFLRRIFTNWVKRLSNQTIF